ncbi:hypothetical protein GWK47_053819 [Chionoecetes opilio]|uniref:Uncharacterized protein n=1 Tax=Chionoecetes opilio TaxID=41210 RepID=A0A8J4XZ95_CHIOP|nr:hypothetical protein GWK47_053819 [Chionoecetes opilio]
MLSGQDALSETCLYPHQRHDLWVYVELWREAATTSWREAKSSSLRSSGVTSAPATSHSREFFPPCMEVASRRAASNETQKALRLSTSSNVWHCRNTSCFQG